MMISKTLLVKLKAPRMAAPICTLIGPPEIQSFINQLKMETLPETSNGNLVKIETSPEKPAIRDPFVDCMVSNFNNTQLPQYPKSPMGFTENLSPTYLSSGNPCLDFFFHVVPDTPFQSVQERLQKAWNHDPLTSLKLICNLRDFRGAGKSDKEGFYASALWLHQFHPKTLAGNISSMARFGYIKDLPEILYRLLKGSDVRKTRKAEWSKIKNGSRKRYCTHSHTPWTKENKKENKKERGQREGRISNVALKANREMRIFNMLERGKLLKQKASLLREKKRIAMAKKVLEKYHKDSAFRFLYERISDFFAEHLKADMEYYKSNETRKVSLAAKWCPSLDSSFDKSMLLCESIARKVFPRESYPEYEGLEEAHYVYRVRDRLRKEVLVPLRKALELPEVYISLNKWDEIQYDRVASVAMKLYKYKFLEHDAKRFRKFLKDGRSRKCKTAAGEKLPYEIITSLKDGDGGQAVELQWKAMVDDLRNQGKLKNCMAISKVSGNMNDTSLEVSVALGLLISELGEEPWKGNLITFSSNPTLRMVEGETLSEKAKSIKRNVCHLFEIIDLGKVFDIILEVAVNGKLKEEDMIQTLFVFAQKEFNYASASSYIQHGHGRPYWMMRSQSSWETDYEAIVRKFTEKGYGNAVPKIVFWNLRDSKSTPVVEGKKGVTIVSGFSKNFLKLLLNGDAYTDPVFVMENAISRKEYRNLSVID